MLLRTLFVGPQLRPVIGLLLMNGLDAAVAVGQQNSTGLKPADLGYYQVEVAAAAAAEGVSAAYGLSEEDGHVKDDDVGVAAAAVALV